ncbi:YkvA family protein [Winslowiella toletana]|uniref:YkvA family protein n=1 Tax=Winslowiella toletana TaxID=92490 RepID=UPI0028BD2311|nr:YkvA family protein [Winslowiella toletana]WNN43029.1 YkvA family protein [Winslowiella toletana]
MFKRIVKFKSNLTMMWYACRNPHTPLYIKGLLGVVTLYLISPLDIIPDVIPVIGWLDDAIVVPLGISLLLKLLPDEVRADAAMRLARSPDDNKRKGLSTTLLIIVLLWLILLAYAIFHWMS